MKITRLLPLSLIVLTRLASASSAKDVMLSSYINEDQTEEIEYRVSLDTALKAPAYHPLSQQNPPLSVKKAVEIGLQSAKARHGNAEPRALWSISLQRSYGYSSKGIDYTFWYYDLTFNSDSRPFEGVFVLMDGTVACERVVKLTPEKTTKKHGKRKTK